MAWSTSKLFTNFLVDLLKQDVAYDLDAATLKAALFNNTGTPDADAVSTLIRYNTGQWVAANEVTSSGQWDAGGRLIGSPTITSPGAGIVMFDALDTASGSAATLANVFGALVHADGVTNKPGISFNYFGGAQSVTAGTFTVVWAANGIARFTLT